MGVFATRTKLRVRNVLLAWLVVESKLEFAFSYGKYFKLTVMMQTLCICSRLAMAVRSAFIHTTNYIDTIYLQCRPWILLNGIDAWRQYWITYIVHALCTVRNGKRWKYFARKRWKNIHELWSVQFASMQWAQAQMSTWTKHFLRVHTNYIVDGLWGCIARTLYFYFFFFFRI